VSQLDITLIIVRHSLRLLDWSLATGGSRSIRVSATATSASWSPQPSYLAQSLRQHSSALHVGSWRMRWRHATEARPRPSVVVFQGRALMPPPPPGQPLALATDSALGPEEGAPVIDARRAPVQV